MQISLNWLRDYIDLDGLSTDDIARSLTDIGLEVEGVADLSAIKGDVVVGRIIEASPHPNANSLKVCKVDVGRSEPLAIVCGASNARKDLRVAVALVGATLPGDFKIKKSKIRGETSEGMMCSEQELGLSDRHEGIIELPENAKAPIGASVATLMKLNDTVITLSVTPNRPDCLGHIGIARDLGARLKRPLKAPSLAYQSAVDLRTEDQIHIAIESPEDCDRFCALLIKDVRAVPSPKWLQSRLEAAGMRPINLIVDITNYVLLEYAQPVHAYDLRDLSGGTLAVRRPKMGETITTLDGKVQTLDSNDILIADADRPVGLAGIMGGANSEVRPDTADIVLEVACFDPVRVRKTSKRLGIHTEASHRFERGVDVDATADALRRLAALFDQTSRELRAAGAEIPTPQIAGTFIDHYPKRFTPRPIALRLDRLRRLSGLSMLTAEDVTGPLGRLGVKLTDQKDDRLLFMVPSWRHDLEREVDLIEEVVRMIGFDKVPYTMPMMEIRTLPEAPHLGFIESLEDGLAVRGFSQTILFPFISKQDMERFRFLAEHPCSSLVRLANPLSADDSALQPTLIPGLVKAALSNRNTGRVTNVRIFQSARGYIAATARADDGYWSYLNDTPEHFGERARSDASRPREYNLVAGLLSQPLSAKTWESPETAASFYATKAHVLALLKSVGLTDVTVEPINASELPYLHPGTSAVVKSGATILGYLGELHPEVAAAYELPFDPAPFVFELIVDRVHSVARQSTRYDSTPWRFPATTRDLALVVDRQVTHADVMQALKTFRRRNLTAYHLFDVYAGTNVAEGKKSMAYNLSFRSAKKTLSDAEVDAEVQLLLQWLSEKVGAGLRGQ